MRRRAGLRIVTRSDTGALTIVGTVAGVRVRRRAQSDDHRLAAEEAATLEAEILRVAWHGERRGSRSFAEAVTSYLASKPRTNGTKRRLHRLLIAVGDVKLSEINQQAVNRATRRMLAPSAAPATLKRSIITPLRAVLRHAYRQGWCEPPVFEIPRESKGRTNYLLPSEAVRLVAAASPALRVLLEFILGTGARMSEALELDWRDVDLAGARAIFWVTKNGKPRNAHLPPRIVALLTNLRHREGPVIRRPDGQPYANRNREGGGQVKTAWQATKRRAGIDATLTLHDLRHTWASWHYATHRDPLKLKVEGGWSSLDQVERYAHLLPAGHERDIEAFWHGTDTSARSLALSA